MDQIEFKKSIRKGTILCFETNKTREGHTSVEYTVNAYKDSIDTGKRDMVFSTHITFVCLDENGKKQQLCKK